MHDKLVSKTEGVNECVQNCDFLHFLSAYVSKLLIIFLLANVKDLKAKTKALDRFLISASIPEV